jgi:hypothetical protein
LHLARLRFRIGTRFGTDQSSIKLQWNRHEVELKSQNADQPLSETDWVVLVARGFESEASAVSYGNALKDWRITVTVTEYSVERLMGFLTAFDQDVEIVARPRQKNGPRGSIRFRHAAA